MHASWSAGSDRSVLEAFFLGRAFAETVNDRLGAALGDLLSEIAKADAERRHAWRWVCNVGCEFNRSFGRYLGVQGIRK